MNVEKVMNRVIYRVVLAFVFSCFLVSIAAAESFSGVYLNVHDSSGAHSRVYIDEKDGIATIRLIGGHPGKREDVFAPSDCEILAKGTIEEGRVEAKITNSDYPKDLYVYIDFGDDELVVEYADAQLGGCGMYTRFYGVYQKYSCSELKKKFQRDLPHYREHPKDLENLCQ